MERIVFLPKERITYSIPLHRETAIVLVLSVPIAMIWLFVPSGRTSQCKDVDDKIQPRGANCDKQPNYVGIQNIF